MPPTGLETLIRTRVFAGEEVVVLRPGIALVMYSTAEMGQVMAASAEVLEAYLDFVPPGSIAARYVPPPDEYAPDSFTPFDASSRADLLGELRAGPPDTGEEGYGFELTATLDGQAGDFGFSLGAIDLALSEDAQTETSLLRLELPWNLLDVLDVSVLVSFLERAAGLFPFCSGNAGMSFSYTVGYSTAASDEMQKLLPRYIGFDSSFGGAQLEMRGKSPPAHWLNLLDAKLVSKLGGEERLRAMLAGCEVRSLAGGLLIRAAKHPPVVDVNSYIGDIGLLPVVARALAPVRFDAETFTPLADEDRGRAWLERFDDFEPGPWEND